MSDDHGPWGSPSATATRPAPPARRLPRLALVAIIAVAVAGLVFGLSRLFPQSLSDTEHGYIGYYVVWLGAVSASMLARGVRVLAFLRAIAIWAVILAALVLGYSFRDDGLGLAQRLLGEVSPATAIATAPGVVTVAQGEGGAYVVMGRVNGQPVRFMVDTGASDIVLTPTDARRVGINVASLAYDHPVETASGVDRAARASVSSLAVGDLRLGPTEVSVNRADMDASLLGMAYLRRLDSFAFKDHRLVMRGPVHPALN